MLEARSVSKFFGDLVALSDVSFEVGPGVTALLGPNGAGKSTMLRVLCGLTRPSRGEVRVLGMRPRRDLALFGRLGLVPQQEGLPETLTARRFVAAAAGLEQVRGAEVAAARALEVVDLDPADPRPLRTYSKGMRQRVKVAQALVHDPEVLVLDEPLNGLDPTQRVRMIDLFRHLGNEGRCVLVSSHVLDEVERLGSRVLVLVDGHLAAEGDFRAIRDLMDERPHRLRIRAGNPTGLGAALLARGAVSGVHTQPGDPDAHDVIWVDTVTVAELRRAVVEEAARIDARLYEVVPLDEDLESVFRYLVARPVR